MNKLKKTKIKYENLYDNIEKYISIKLKARGIHDLIIHNIKSDLKNKNVLDVGCGLGRLSLLMAHYAKYVVGIDFTKNAIDIANHLKFCTDIDNVNFIYTSLEDYNPKEKFDVIVLSGTLEHLIECNNLVQKLSKMIKKNGILITDSPSEFNFRGTFHASLWKLFNFPMTLSDVQIITPTYMSNLAKKNRFHIERKVGTLYSRAWGKAGIEDLKVRMKNVVADVRHQIKKIKVTFPDYYRWLDEANVEFEKLLQIWKSQKILKVIPARRKNFKINKNYLKINNLPIDRIYEYLSPDFSIDPLYSEKEPYINFSGNIIYFLRKK